MRPPYILLLASPHDPRVSGFCSPPSPFVPQHPAPKLQLRSGHAAPSRRTARTSSTPAASCGRTHHETTRQRGSTLGAVGAARRNRPLRWIGRSASARLAQHASSHRSSRASSSTGSGERGPRSASAVPNDPTAASHAYLSEFLGMTEEELQQLSAKYLSLPANRRGPNEITVASPELAAAAAAAAEAAAAAVTAATAGAAVAVAPAEGSSAGGARGGGGGGGGGGKGKETAAEAEAAVNAAADRAAAAAAGQPLIPEIPALASMLHQQLGVPKERVKQLLLRWPRLLEVSGLHLRECVQWLTETLGLRQEEIAELVLGCPPLLFKSINFQLKPNLNWLENDLGLTRAEARRAVCSCPHLLAKCVSSNVLPRVKFFYEVLGFDREGVASMLLRYPQLFNFSLENMAWKARWLNQEMLMDRHQVKRVLGRSPSIFAYSAERNLVPTLEFFLDDLGATKAQVREAVIEKPRLLGMSLENRLVPRLQEIRKAGFTPSWELHHEVMLFASDIVFRRWLKEEPMGSARRREKVQGGILQTSVAKVAKARSELAQTKPPREGPRRAPPA